MQESRETEAPQGNSDQGLPRPVTPVRTEKIKKGIPGIGKKSKKALYTFMNS